MRVLGLGAPAAGTPAPATVAHALIEAHQVTHSSSRPWSSDVLAALREGAAGTGELAATAWVSTQPGSVA